MRSIGWAVILLVIVCSCSVNPLSKTSVSTNGGRFVIDVGETDELLVNPGMGFTTFHCLNGKLTYSDYPECSIAYYRFYWDDFEKTKGQFEFEEIDGIIAGAVAKHQKLAFRFMAASDESYADGVRVPQWLIDLGAKGTWYGDGSKAFMPDFGDPIFMSNALDVMQAFGSRYGTNDNIDHVDVGWVGHWGEWHIWRAESAGASMPSVGVQKWYIDKMRQIFPNVPVLMQINGQEVLAYGASNRCGWRADSLGDRRGGWNHLDNMYPQALAYGKIGELWKTQPVAFETWGVMGDWFWLFWDVDYILKWALDYHVSIVNAKSSPIPMAYYDKILAFQKKMGYRFVLDTVRYPLQVARGVSFTIASVWQNRGVAPVYRDYRIAFRIRSESQTVTNYVLTNELREWIPGTYNADITVTIASNIAPGSYDLEAGIVEKDGATAAIKPANTGRNDDNWVIVYKFYIE